MFDSQCDLAALVYGSGQNPNAVLRTFTAELSARGYRAVGPVQFGHHCVDTPDLSATLVHSGESGGCFRIWKIARNGAGLMSACS